MEVAVEQSARPSLPRSGHCAAALPSSHSHDVIIFGGYTEEFQKAREATNEAWIFSSKAGTWQPVTYAPGDVPRVRLVSQAVVVGLHLYVIGGWDPGHNRDGGEILSDIWKLDLQSYAWSQVHPEGEALPKVSRHQAAAVGDKVYIHTHRNTGDILVLDTAASTPTLSLLPIAGPEGYPMSRGLHSLTAVGNKLFLYAGAPKEGPMLGDLWELDTVGCTWREVDTDGQMPHVRCSQAAAAVGDSIVFFGGSYYKDEGGLQPLEEVFVFNNKTLSWEWPKLVGRGPKARNAGSLTPLPDGRLLAYGGWHAFVETYNDTFILQEQA